MMYTVENQYRDYSWNLAAPRPWWIARLSRDRSLWNLFNVTTAPEQYSLAPYVAWVDYIHSPTVVPFLHKRKAARSLKLPDALVVFLVGHRGTRFRYTDGKMYYRTEFAAELNKIMPVHDARGPLGQPVKHEDRNYRRINCANGHWDAGDTMCIVSSYHYHLVSENQVRPAPLAGTLRLDRAVHQALLIGK